MCIIKEVVCPLYIVVLWGMIVRNRGYKYIINSDENGFWMLCVNPAWINELLRERGIEPKVFRSLSWKDIAGGIADERLKELFYILRPNNFWQMCDVVALSMSRYACEDSDVFYQNWFIRYPIFTLEDIFEILNEEELNQEDALRIMEVVRKGGKTDLNVSLRDFVELYDVSDRLTNAICKCEYLIPREKAIRTFLDILSSSFSNIRQYAEFEKYGTNMDVDKDTKPSV